VKISIDLDCTLWHHQNFFRALIPAMQAAGHQVGILTSHKIIHRPADLALLRERGFPEPNFYLGRALDSKGEDYAILKARAIRENGVDMHFDDGLAEQIRTELGEDAYRVIAMTPRGREDEHYD
jgi:hypothetical protein